MIKTPYVSVLMPVYNSGAYSRAAVESILNQTFTDYEFIIINDGSTDGSANVLSDYSQIDKRIRLYHQRNQGYASTLNKGVALAAGALIARMDHDDVAFPNRLELQIAAFAKDPDLVLLGGSMILINNEGVAFDTLTYPLEDAQIKSAILHGNPFAHPTVMFRKNIFQSVGGYRTAFSPAEDYDLWLRISEHHKLANLREPLLNYRIHSSQDSSRSITQQIICMLAAQESARHRIATGKDPFDFIDQLTPEVLLELGVTSQQIERQIALGYESRAWISFKVGDHQSALKLLYRALQETSKESRPNVAGVVANQALEYFGKLYSQNRFKESIRYLILALKLSPSLRWNQRMFRSVAKGILGRRGTEAVRRAMRFFAKRVYGTSER